MQELHDEEFSNTDCLECVNWCEIIDSLFSDKDVEGILKFLKINPRQFEDQYLRTDEDGDLILQQTLCTFLGADNYWAIYEVRPKACREYHIQTVKSFNRYLI
ncbi:Fe-S-cluster containining protein [Aquimarina sp. EL_43]|nr:Fe-S-cluster containining protein [Aquimarina sp. EL_35]MBG6149714.1 Fe-S-cluster containining protein [Aquimarina sp. EL_32]MBG6167601.1 Fe-S-cluster containining protein [Aquimarina sp. EL_43]